MTNLEYIKSLGAKEIADLICGEEGYCEMCVNKGAYICKGQSCSDGIILWLLSEREEELKPCPFCGSEARAHETEGVWYLVFCNNCSAEVKGGTKAEAIEAWNRRVE